MHFLTVKEAAARLGVCTRTILRRIGDGDLPAYKLSGSIYSISEDDLNAYIAGKRTVKK